MQFVFRVTVPFIAISRETLTQSTTARFPSGETALLDLLVREVGDGRYDAISEIESPHPSMAKLQGVSKVEKFLQILAVSNDLFEVEISSVTAEVIREVDPAGTTVTNEGNVLNVVASETVFVSEHLDLVKKKESLEFESKALASAEEWPDYLRRGIDLNYSALRAAVDDVRFFLLASALDILTLKKLGSSGLLKSKLELTDYDKFKKESKKFLQSWGFNKEEMLRLWNNLVNTDKEPKAQQMVSYLESTNVQGFSPQEVKSWWYVRGEIAHGNAVNLDELQPALSQISQAVQSALREELSRL